MWTPSTSVVNPCYPCDMWTPATSEVSPCYPCDMWTPATRVVNPCYPCDMWTPATSVVNPCYPCDMWTPATSVVNPCYPCDMWTPATYVVSPRYLNCGPLLYTWTLLHGEWTRAINEPLLRDLYYLRTTSVTSATCGVWTSTTSGPLLPLNLCYL